MYDRSDSLFAGISAFEVISRSQAHAMDELKALDDNRMLTTPREDLVQDVLKRHTLSIPILLEDQTYIDDREVKSEVQQRNYSVFSDRGPGSISVTTHIVSFHIPYSGDGSIFNVSPTTRSVPGPSATVKGQELIIQVTTNGRTEIQVRNEFINTLQSINQHLGTLKNDLSSITRQIEAPARLYIDQRKAQLLKSKNLVASLGFPMKRRHDSPVTYAAPEIRRKLNPVRQQVVDPFRPEPKLDEQEYLYILNIMENMTRVMERSPRAFRSMGEEDIRQHFLVQLNGQYEGQATGETFNFQGKTDILIRSDGRNIFIAECKFWHGEKAFLETVEQLISYLSWRDSKTSILVFNRNKNLTGVIESIKGAMERHAEKKHGPTVEGETRLRYVMGNPGDRSREIIVTVMVFDIPAAD